MNLVFMLYGLLVYFQGSTAPDLDRAMNQLAHGDEGAMCEVKHKDAKSALKRVKTKECRLDLHRVSCLSESKHLFVDNITRLCPVPRSKGGPSHTVEVKAEYGPPIRILYAMVVHGRALRQVKRLFKALFHTNHYFYFHVDSVSNDV